MPFNAMLFYYNNYYYECTMDQKLADAAECAAGRRCVCTRQMTALFCLK